MLSTKNITTDSSRNSKTLLPGVNEVKINSISLVKGYDADSYKVILDLEGPEIGEGFEGFLTDYEDKDSPRHLGQIGRVRLSQYDYKDGATKSGKPVKRDQGILQSLLVLAKTMGKEEDLNKVEADTIEEFVAEANTVLSGDTYFNVVLGGKTYEKGGYTKYDLFIPYGRDGKFSMEAIGVKDSKLMEYDPKIHIVQTKAAETVETFEPVQKHSSFQL